VVGLRTDGVLSGIMSDQHTPDCIWHVSDKGACDCGVVSRRIDALERDVAFLSKKLGWKPTDLYEMDENGKLHRIWTADTIDIPAGG